ncbi:MAG: FAD-dependent oxidoreductase [Deltaproteobacteria bacterium]|nr:FAD-dependent oxidoreductase [Deltaproteobacteria bacterium]
MDYDVIVLGAGTAGSNAAKTAVKMGANTSLVEEDGFAGTCLARG